MRRPPPTAIAAATLLTALTLVACQSAEYRNATNLGYGSAEYKNDLEQCRNANSEVVISSGYDDKSELKVDAARAQACMAERGWQAAR